MEVFFNQTESGGAEGDLDSALLAFVKCHVNSPPAWDALRYLAEREGEWIGASELARAIHRPSGDVVAAMRSLVADGVVEDQAGDLGQTFRLPSDEPTTVVLHRLVETCMHDQQMRMILAAHMLRNTERRAA